MLLAALGGVLGLGLAVAAVSVLGRFGPAKIPRIEEIGIDGRVLAFTFAISLITGVVFGLVPALRASRLDLNDVLREGGAGGGTRACGMGTEVRNMLIRGRLRCRSCDGRRGRSSQVSGITKRIGDSTRGTCCRSHLARDQYKTPGWRRVLPRPGTGQGAAWRAVRRLEYLRPQLRRARGGAIRIEG